jgi:adenosylhomocysteine nucleosidase
VAAELNPVLASPPCILFALAREAMFFYRAFPLRRRLAGGPCPAAVHEVDGTAVLSAITGVGAAATEAALDWLLEGYRPSVLIAAGFCGALHSQLRIGDLVIPREVLQGGRRWTPAPHSELAGGHTGAVVSVDAVVSDPLAKQRLAAETGAIAVDMESATVARWCEEHGLPWLCVRAVSDDDRTQLPAELAQVLQGGRVAPLRLMATILWRPSLLRCLWRLERDTRQAAHALAEGLRALALHRSPLTPM